MTTIADIQKMVFELAQAKQSRQDIENKHKQALMEVEIAKNIAKSAEEKLRASAMEYFLETGDIKPHDAITVKHVTRFKIMPEDNLDLVMTNAPELLQIDMSEFKKLIKEGKAPWAVQREVSDYEIHLQSKLGEFLISESEFE